MKKKVITRHRMTKRIIGYELIGFALVIVAIWADEVFDIPFHFFGAPLTEVNIAESIWESALILTLGILVIYFSWRCLNRIKYLEGFLRVCTFCKKIRVGENWIPIELYIQANSETEFSHGLCSHCMEEHYGISSDD